MLALTYQLFAALAGWLEAILYARRGAESFSSNEHTGMTLQRLAVLLVAAAAVGLFRWHGLWLVLAEVVPTALLFPLCHDEAYNFTRLWIDMKALGDTALRPDTPAQISDQLAWDEAWHRYRYGYQSPTTTARNDFNGRARTWLAIIGALLLLGLYLLPAFHLFPF